MFKKYEKTYRIKIPEYDVKGKFCLSKDEVRFLLGGKVTIEEKMDGANAGIIRHSNGFHLQKRGSLVGPSEHEQFKYFNNWAYFQNWDKIMALPKGYIVYGELLYVIHTVYYDSLPDFFLVFDVWNGKRFLRFEERRIFCDKYEFHMVPTIFRGYMNIENLHKIIPKASRFGDYAEGILVKKYKKKGVYVRGKIVKPDFQKSIEDSGHWRHQQIKLNRLAT